MAAEPTDAAPGNAEGADAPRHGYTVIGMGAVGGYYGARLAAAGHRVRFVARSDAEHARREGLRVESPHGDLHLHPDTHGIEVHDATTDLDPDDVVLVAVKTTDAAEAARLLGPVVGPGTVVVALQNGLGVEATLAEAAPGADVLGGMCFVCINKVGPAHVRHLDFGAVTLGQHAPGGGPAGVTPAVEAVAADLEAAGVPAHRIDDLGTGRWRKLVWNIPYNGLSVVLDAGTDELMADPATRALVRDLMVEVVTAATACGHPIEDAFVDHMLRTTEDMTPYAPSMKLDHDAGRPLELDAIYAAPIAAAARAGVAMVRTDALHRQLQFLDARRRRT